MGYTLLSLSASFNADIWHFFKINLAWTKRSSYKLNILCKYNSVFFFFFLADFQKFKYAYFISFLACNFLDLRRYANKLTNMWLNWAEKYRFIQIFFIILPIYTFSPHSLTWKRIPIALPHTLLIFLVSGSKSGAKST